MGAPVRLSSVEARELAIREVQGRPGILQVDLAQRLHEATGLASSTLVRELRGLERQGAIEGWFEGRRKAYRLAPQAVAADTLSRGRRRELVLLLGALLGAAGIVAFFLTPSRSTFDGVPTDPAEVQAPARHVRVDPLAPARRERIAVLSGVAVPHVAARTGARLERQGLQVAAVANAPGPSERSLVLYERGAARAARALARSLGIEATGPLAGPVAEVAAGARLVVVLGADRR